ncbi:hypothetical protein [Teichococcus vastitatis]|uniref:Uncharacterized protein n=1 Tax=Teichococcus vastitatis TaxID=2307076 RepID=A0ABS9WAY1_9PROT|nr:hypothetical protein [Pseudoroseomonas vastitatis]MCI0756158.1 hypothetical protein [Pseudoroseomonas vastitatis]
MAFLLWDSFPAPMSIPVHGNGTAARREEGERPAPRQLLEMDELGRSMTRPDGFEGMPYSPLAHDFRGKALP